MKGLLHMCNSDLYGDIYQIMRDHKTDEIMKSPAKIGLETKKRTKPK